MKSYSILISAALMVVSFSVSAVEPSFDCSKSDSDAEDAICSVDALAELDIELSRLYSLAIHGPHMTADRETELKAMQRGWIKGRNECWKSSLGLETCVTNSYAMRIHELRAGYFDSRSADTEGVSLGPLALDCEGFDAGISAVYINTSKPLVSLMWKDSGIVLPLAPTGSGAKYESDMWDDGPALLWTKGEEATFRPPGGPEYNCVIGEIG